MVRIVKGGEGSILGGMESSGKRNILEGIVSEREKG